MGKPDLGALIAQTIAPPAEERDIETITGENVRPEKKIEGQVCGSEHKRSDL